MLTVDVGYQMTTENTVITYNSAGKLEGIVEHTKNTATKKEPKLLVHINAACSTTLCQLVNAVACHKWDCYT